VRARRRQGPERDPAPTWPQGGGSQPRVLIEHPDPEAQQGLAEGLRARGYAVLTCGGPRAAGVTDVSCPLLRQQHCPGVDDADVVVSGLPLANALERTIIRRIARSPGDRSLIVQMAPDDIEEHSSEWDVDATVAPLTVASLLRALEELHDAGPS
jgi:hypothetical protein